VRTWLSVRILLYASVPSISLAIGCGDRSAKSTSFVIEKTARAKNAPTAASPVSIDNFTYAPQTLTVAIGTKVTWTNRDDVPHTVTSKTKPRVLESPTLDSDESFSYVFTAPGTYEYYCTVHPKMTGRIIVK